MLLKYFPLIRPMYLDKGDFTREEGPSNKESFVRGGSGPTESSADLPNQTGKKRECRRDLSLAVLASATQATLPSGRGHSRGTCIHCVIPGLCPQKKMHNMRVTSSVITGANWGQQTADSASDGSGRQLQRGRGETSAQMWFWWKGIHVIKHVFFQKVSTCLVKLCLSRETVIPMKDFSAFLDMRRYKNWAHKISSWA